MSLILINKLKEIEESYNFNYILTNDELLITDEYGKTIIHIFNIDIDNEECISHILFLLCRFDLSYTLEFGNCKELIDFIKTN